MVRLNKTTILLTGGSDGSLFQNKTYVFSSTEKVWTPGPEMLTARATHACGLLTIENKTTCKIERVVVVAGEQKAPPCLTQRSFIIWIDPTRNFNEDQIYQGQQLLDRPWWTMAAPWSCQLELGWTMHCSSCTILKNPGLWWTRPWRWKGSMDTKQPFWFQTTLSHATNK